MSTKIEKLKLEDIWSVAIPDVDEPVIQRTEASLGVVVNKLNKVIDTLNSLTHKPVEKCVCATPAPTCKLCNGTGVIKKVCPFRKCWVSDEDRDPDECPYAFVNEKGEADCGYG